MERITLRIPQRDVQGLEELVESGEYPNRSAAVRDAIDDLLDEHGTRPRMVADGSGEVGHDVVFEEMTADDWEEYLRENPVKLLVRDRDGEHAVEWDDVDEKLTFYAHGSMGYNYDGTRAVLEEIAGQSDGLRLVEKAVADGGTQKEALDVREDDDGRILVTIRGRHGTIQGWEESREDLGLNKHGDPVEGVEIVEEVGEYHEEDDEYPYGYSEVTLAFDDVIALRHAREHLYEKATERFEWGADGKAVQNFVGRLPTDSEVGHHV